MKAVKAMARTMWQSGGIRAYYRGLTLGLVGVFPYSAIDMGTYETLRRAYCKSMKVDEPGVMATLSFGALSGSIGAASVYRECFSSIIAYKLRNSYLYELTISRQPSSNSITSSRFLRT
jgi:hypothetical protein